MGAEWRTLKVSEFADVIGGGTPKTKMSEYWNGSIPWLTPKDLSSHLGRFISKGERNISKKGLSNSSARLLPPKTVLLTSRAPVGYLAISKNELTTNQGFRSLIVRDEFIPEFIYYLLLNNVEYLKRHASGSTFQELSGGTLKELEFEVPVQISEQRAIAHILGSLDDKIELNLRMNQTLETTARAIFKSWFVDFEPVRAKAEGRPTGLPDDVAALFPDSLEDSELGEIPEGWSTVTLPEIIEVNPPRKLRKGQIAPYLEMKNMPENSSRPLDWYDREFGSGVKFVNGDTLMARITPCLENGKGAFVDFLEDGQVGWGSTEYIVFRAKKPLPLEYSYFLTRSTDFRSHAIVNMTGSSGRQRVPASIFDSYLVVRPSEEVAEYFGMISASTMQKIKKNDEETRTLASLRDTLLPKLITGELRVPDAEKIVEEVI